jgi:hypothetical protein
MCILLVFGVPCVSIQERTREEEEEEEGEEEPLSFRPFDAPRIILVDGCAVKINGRVAPQEKPRIRASRIFLSFVASVTTQILAFLGYWYGKKGLQMHF